MINFNCELFWCQKKRKLINNEESNINEKSKYTNNKQVTCYTILQCFYQKQYKLLK